MQLNKLLRKTNENYHYLAFGLGFLCLLVFLGFVFNGGGNDTIQQPVSETGNVQLTEGQSDLQAVASSEADARVERILGEFEQSAAISPGQDYTNQYTQALVTSLTTLISSSAGPGPDEGIAIYRNIHDDSLLVVPVYSNTGAIETLMSGVGLMYETKPASTEVWARDIGERLNIGAFAQDSSPTYNPGQGFNLLSPVRDLWQMTSNLAYIFYILIVIGVAFLIIFRSQLDGQNAINLFNAIPSIIISLVFVYFSYPLSAVFIDLVTVGSGVTYGTLIGNVPQNEGGTAPGAYLLNNDYNFVSYRSSISFPVSQNVGDPIDAQTQLQMDDSEVSIWNIFRTANVRLTTDGAGALVPEAGFLGDLFANAIGGLASLGIVGTVLQLVFVFAAFAASLKLFFALIREYLILMIYPVLAPFIFLFAAIPGQTGKLIGGYFKRLLAASLTFVAIYAVFLVIIIISRSPNEIGDVAWLPPLVGYSTGGSFDQLSGGDISTIAKPLIAYAMFISTPLIPDAIQNFLATTGDNSVGENIKMSSQVASRTLAGLSNVLNNVTTGALGIQPRQR